MQDAKGRNNPHSLYARAPSSKNEQQSKRKKKQNNALDRVDTKCISINLVCTSNGQAEERQENVQITYTSTTNCFWILSTFSTLNNKYEEG